MTPRMKGLMAAVATLVAIVLVGSVVLLAIKSNGDQSDRVGLEALRNCIRSNYTSATFKRPGTNIPIETQENLFPIIDCKASQLSGKLIVINKVETDKYTALVLKGRAPIINKGKVVGFRGSLLQGIESVEEAGTE